MNHKLLSFIFVISFSFVCFTSYSQDTDGDGIANSLDLDDDNDGILDSAEQCGSPAILDWTETEIDTNPSNIVTSLAGNPVIINAEVVSSSGTNPSFGGDSHNYSGSVSADAGTALNGNVQLSLYQNNFENLTKVTFNITPNDFGNLNLFISDAEITDFVVYAEDATATRLSTGAWTVTSYEQNGTTPASAPNPYTINGTDISFDASIASQNDDAMRVRFDTQTLTIATKIVIETTKLTTGSGDTVEFMLTSSCPNNDTDNDTIPDYQDIDSDNDGIPDNVETQSTLNYTTPSGSINTSGPYIGLWDNYGTGLALEDTDSDDIPDYIDTDSDNDGTSDIQENGMANAVLGTDTDSDGLDDNFEGVDLNDPLDVNDEIDNPASSILPDSDTDLGSGGDLDYRDAFVGGIGTLNFDGIDDYFEVPTSLINNLDEYTVSFWFKPEALPSTPLANTFIFGQKNVYEVYMRNVSGNINLYSGHFYNTTQGGAVGTQVDATNWMHYTATVNHNSQILRHYINGVDSGGQTLFTPRNFNINPLRIGSKRASQPDPDEENFEGWIDEVRIFDTILTRDQIRQMIYQEIENKDDKVHGTLLKKDIVNISTNATIPWSNLIAYYPMTNIIGNIARDESLNSNNGFLYNMTSLLPQTAPMPYETVANGDWTAESTWLYGNVWDIEDVPDNKDWSIVQIHDNVTTSNSHTQLGMLIDDTKTLTVTGDNEINNSWYLQLNGTINLLGDSQLVQGINSDLVTGLNGKILRRQEGNLNYFRYNYWTSPVGAKAITNNTNTNFSLNMLKDGSESPIDFTAAPQESGKVSSHWLYKFQNGQTYFHWVALTPSSAIEPGVGYSHKGTNDAPTGGDQQYLFEGKPNNGTILLVADDVNDGDGTEEHVDVEGTRNYTSTLIGNPYPSALDAEQFLLDNASAIDGAIYMWEQWSGNSHYLIDYEGGYGTINIGATTPAYQWNDPSQTESTLAKEPTPFIPVGQGFFVEVVADLGTIEFNNSQRVFKREATGESIFFRNSESENTKATAESSPMGLVRLELNVSNGNKRNFVLLFGDQTTDGFDYGYDARTIDPQPDDLNSFLGDEKMVIQSYAPITNNKVVDLVFNSTGTYNYTLEIIELENISDNQGIYLRDNLTGSYFDLRSGAYSFSSDESGEDTERFDVVFQSAEALSNDEFDTTDVLIFVNNTEDKLYIKGLTTQAKQLSLTNMLGQNIKSYYNINNQTLENGLDISNLSSGVYLVNLNSENGTQLSKKIILD